MGAGVGKVDVVIKARARESGSNVLTIFSTVLSPGIASTMTKRGELLLLLVRSRPGSSSFTASALNKPSSSSSYAGPVRPAAALRDSVLCLPTDIHSLFVNKPSSSSSSSSMEG